MPFIPFMLCERLTDPTRLQDPRYIAEPKLGGQRRQLHIHQGRSVAYYSRRGLDLLRHAGMLWLQEITWPVSAAVLDGEAVAGDGHKESGGVRGAREAGRAHGVHGVRRPGELDGQRV